MGASQSNSNINVVNQAIINAVIDTANNCSLNANQYQGATISGFGIGSSISQSSSINVECLQKVKVDQSLINNMTNNILQAAQANSVALEADYSGANASTNISNYLSTTVTDSTIQNCATQVQTNQQAAISGVQVGASIKQDITVFSECMQDALDSIGVSSTIATTSNNSATATNTSPFDFTTTIMLIVVAIFAFILAYIVYTKYKNSPSQYPQTQYPPRQYPQAQYPPPPGPPPNRSQSVPPPQQEIVRPKKEFYESTSNPSGMGYTPPAPPNENVNSFMNSPVQNNQPSYNNPFNQAMPPQTINQQGQYISTNTNNPFNPFES